MLPSTASHVTLRGIGRRNIFEDDQDRRRFLKTLSIKLRDENVVVYAWCLMDNHVHILLSISSADLSRVMQRLGTSYAQYFNGRHGHVGRVFQNRFGTYSVESDAHLLTAVRYIHRNPLEADAKDLIDSPWTSFREITGYSSDLEGRGIVDAQATLDLFGGLASFLEFHQRQDEHDDFVRVSAYGPRLDDANAREIAVRRYGDDFADAIIAMPKCERDRALAMLKIAGLSIRQIERLTGIGRKVVASARLP